MRNRAIDQTKTRPDELRFLIKDEGEFGFLAVCLEHYIGAQGRTKEEAQERLQIAYRAELDYTKKHTGRSFEGIPPAPDTYQDLYESGDVCLVRGTIYDKYGAVTAVELAA